MAKFLIFLIIASFLISSSVALKDNENYIRENEEVELIEEVLQIDENESLFEKVSFASIIVPFFLFITVLNFSKRGNSNEKEL